MPTLIKIDENNRVVGTGLRSLMITEGVGGAEVRFFPENISSYYSNDSFPDTIGMHSPTIANKREMIILVEAVGNTNPPTLNITGLRNFGENWNAWVVGGFLGNDGQITLIYDISISDFKRAGFGNVSYSFIGIRRRAGVNYLEQGRGNTVNYSTVLSGSRRTTSFVRFYIRKERSGFGEVMGIRVWEGNQSWTSSEYEQYVFAPSPFPNSIGILYQNVIVDDFYVSSG